MRRAKRWAVILTALLLAVNVLSACGGGKSGGSGSAGESGSSGAAQTNTDGSGTGSGASSAGTGEEKKEPEPQPPLEISIMLPIFKTNYPSDNSPVVREINERANVKLHLEWVPNASYTDKFNITLASGKLPTIIYVPDVKNPNFVNAVKAGAFWEVGEKMKNYPYLSRANPVIMQNSSIEGKNYGVYRGRALGRNGINYRKDWLENVGLEPPKTIDDF